ncbi:MAG TPA: SDR family oxidoreductase [Candidatus Scatomonas pullistercoris]|uniref:dTDP-4-dehydrorhamnose reductase n=1 Tax=Candidatus Scatomonas pullistercoris TaxID=2840920 RepID=A0A9D1TAR8_9FIRM|nr:SDR family oxidoreductase [Candidatus Scatomonas pullistercoris]
MKFLVLGASGMAGHVICIYLKEQGHDVVGFSRRGVKFVESIAGDVSDFSLLRGIIQAGRFDAVINAVGILNQFAEEDKETAILLNGYLPHYLAKTTADMDTMVIHMSTDCVFSGHTGPYKEDALRDGVTFYDRSKAVGELNDEKNLTLRNSIVGPDTNKNGIGLLNWFMKQSEVNGYTKAMWTGLTTLQLAKTMEKAVETRAHGLVNMVYEENISKYDLLCLFNHYFRNDKVVIHPYDGFSADKTLVRTNFDFDYKVPDYETMIAEMAAWMRKHRELYPHYEIL